MLEDVLGSPSAPTRERAGGEHPGIPPGSPLRRRLDDIDAGMPQAASPAAGSRREAEGAASAPAPNERRVSDDVVMAVGLEELQEYGPDGTQPVPKRHICEEAQQTSPGIIYMQNGQWHLEGTSDEALWAGMEREVGFPDELNVCK